VDHAQGEALACQVVFDAAQDQGAAVALGTGADFFGRHPQGAHNALVQAQVGLQLADVAAKRHAHIGDVFARGRPLKTRQIDAHQGGRGEGVGRFFQGFSGAGLCGRFTGVQVACRVVQAQTLLGVFFDQEVAAIALDDGGHGDIGFPASVHLGIIRLDGSGYARGESGRGVVSFGIYWTIDLAFNMDESTDFIIFRR